MPENITPADLELEPPVDEPPVDEPPVDEPDEAPAAPPRYAVYDETLQRFVSGVLEDRDEAEEIAAGGPESHDLVVREV